MANTGLKQRTKEYLILNLHQEQSLTISNISNKNNNEHSVFFDKLCVAIDNDKLFNIERVPDSKWIAKVKVSCPNRVGMIVGRQGHNIIGHINETDCEVQNPQPLDDPVFTLSCKQLRGLLEMSLWILDEDDKFNTSSNRNNVEIKIRCCSNLVGLLVGTSGETIKKIQEESNCTIQSPPRDDTVKNFSVSGTAEQVDVAYRAMKAHVNDKYKSNESLIYNPQKKCDCEKFHPDQQYVLKCDIVHPAHPGAAGALFHSPDTGYCSMSSTPSSTHSTLTRPPPQHFTSPGSYYTRSPRSVEHVPTTPKYPSRAGLQYTTPTRGAADSIFNAPSPTDFPAAAKFNPAKSPYSLNSVGSVNSSRTSQHTALFAADQLSQQQHQALYNIRACIANNQGLQGLGLQGFTSNPVYNDSCRSLQRRNTTVNYPAVSSYCSPQITETTIDNKHSRGDGYTQEEYNKSTIEGYNILQLSQILSSVLSPGEE